MCVKSETRIITSLKNKMIFKVLCFQETQTTEVNSVETVIEDDVLYIDGIDSTNQV